VAHEIEQGIAWPFADNQFPEGLGVIAQRTVLDGREPVREVVHDAECYWLASDGVNDPNVDGAAVLVCMHHLTDVDLSVAALATMPPGTVAWRDGQDDPWQFGPHTYVE
jgi:hypothetical protein